MGIIDNLKGLLLGEPKKTQGGSITIGEMQNDPLSSWEAFEGKDDVIGGLEFFATLQLRTPLRVLLRNNEIHADKKTKPPQIAREPWEGIWLPKVNQEYDLTGGRAGSCASDIGDVQQDDYLPFLIAIRKEVEAHSSIERRVEALRLMRLEDNWQVYLHEHGGMQEVINKFFPDFISSLPGVNPEIKHELFSIDMDTPNKLSAISDNALLDIRGIGPSKLQKIRSYCEGITNNQDSTKIDGVLR